MKILIEVEGTQEGLKYLMEVLRVLQMGKYVTFFRKVKPKGETNAKRTGSEGG